MTAILAQLGGYSVAQMVIAIIIVISVVGILYVVAKANGIEIPAWVVQIFWIVVVAFVAIFAIRLLMSM